MSRTSIYRRYRCYSSVEDTVVPLDRDIPVTKSFSLRLFCRAPVVEPSSRLQQSPLSQFQCGMPAHHRFSLSLTALILLYLELPAVEPPPEEPKCGGSKSSDDSGNLSCWTAIRTGMLQVNAHRPGAIPSQHSLSGIADGPDRLAELTRIILKAYDRYDPEFERLRQTQNHRLQITFVACAHT